MLGNFETTSKDSTKNLKWVIFVINVKTAHFLSKLSGVLRRHLKIRTGFYFVITVSVISNIWIVGGSKQDYKISKVLNGADQIHLN